MLKLLVLFVSLGAVLGLPSPQAAPGGRIIGGHEVDIHDVPYIVALLLHEQHYCGGVLLDAEWVLTTAHCVDHEFHEHLAIRAGSSSRLAGGDVIPVIQVHPHPQFNPTNVDHDFALLRLAEPVSHLDAHPIELPEPHHPVEEGEEAYIAGWGTLEHGGANPELLHAGWVPVIGREACERAYGERLTESMFCAGGEIDACLGDSGGPVVIDGHLAGLISWGPTICALPDYPGVYADVGHVAEWIIETISDEGPGPEPEPGPGPEPQIALH